MIVIALVVSLGIRFFAYEPFDVLGPSMQPTLQSGDLVLVNKWIYQTNPPQRGDIVVFHAPSEKDYIKRVIGLPGETVEMKNQQLWINGKKASESYLPKTVKTDDFPSITVAKDQLFVMGDNRMNSLDSRSKELGPIASQKLVGKVEMIYWPVADWRLLP